MNLQIDFNNTEEVVEKIKEIKENFNTHMMNIDKAFSTASDETSLEWFNKAKMDWETGGHRFVETAKAGMEGMVSDVEFIASQSKDISKGV